MANTILIADDHDDNRELMQILLSGAGYDVREARNGSECLALAREHLPDLIVMDLSMPGLDGWGVFRELKADQRTLEIPCMAVTAHADLDRGAGAEDRLQRLRFKTVQQRRSVGNCCQPPRNQSK